MFCCNSRKANISLLSKCFWIFLIDWLLNYLCRYFKGLLFRAADILVNFRVLVKFVRYLLKVCDIFLSLLILWFSWRTTVFAVLLFLEKWGLTAIQNLLVSLVLLEFKLIKYCIFHVLELLHIYSIFIPFIQILPVYSSARFIIL